MKKLLCVLLIVALFLPSAVLADETDPIVGVWYICIDSADLASDLREQGYSYGVMLFFFTEKGEIISADVEFNGSSGAVTEPTYIGKWEKKGKEYQTSIISAGVDRAWFEDDLLYVSFNKVQYHGFRKLTPIDLYYNIYRK